MKNITKRAYVIFALIAAFFVGLGVLLYSFIAHGGTWAANRVNNHVFTNRQLSTAGTIYDRNGTVLVTTKDGKRIYSDSYKTRISTLHVVGDSQGYISTGIQTLYRPELIGYNFVDGVYDAVKSKDGINIKLTIDADINAAAYDAMKGNKGTICVYNYKTGEVICMVSAPTYDPNNKPSDIETNTSGKYDGIYLNRFISGLFTPGSTFKVVTTICALENIPDVQKRTFTCKGKYAAKGGDVICNNKSGHGKLTLERALNVSCNCVFAELANELGNDKMTKTVKQLGFDKSVTVARATTKASYFDVNKATSLDLGWAGIGQYTTLVNPCQMLMLAGAIANGGQAVTPYLVEDSANLTEAKGKINKNISLSEETAKKLKKLLRSNVENYYGDSKFPNLKFCGKTGSAEVSNGKSHAWFYGFSQRNDFPYAIVVCLENGGIGYNDAIPATNKVLQAMLNKNY
ncbi:MAG: penicillin-binding transpeptidase domain-containing protein [Faecalibacterium sp.]|nr:penicillin-binding transpeptidase domain-containing protein [Ruminococcus sp.]MCM1392016.1 penicillin-binding transpeptidase domain-containing protein [Ruminococcus sp.]MCM1485724.1 penicillin-binding transpeptidase domain-containing protein [Faecalibacterium sp.]